MKMEIKGIIDECIGDYKKTSMYIAFPKCTFKCDKENGCKLCQNSNLAQQPSYEITIENLVDRYINNPLTSAIVCGGLEPFDTPNSLYNFILTLRQKGNLDDVVIYTGYTEQELNTRWVYKKLKKLPKIIIKFGRFRPNQSPHYDKVLGVNLSSDNQYAKEVSNCGKQNENKN